MLWLSKLVSLMCCGYVMAESGLWNVKYVNKCNEVNHVFKFEISKNRINRTHDGFNAKLTLEEDFTDIFGMRADICKYVDGGCKPFQTLTDTSFSGFCNRFASGNTRSALEAAGVNPPEFPIAAGEYEVNNYIFNYEELPKDCEEGEFLADCYLLEGNVERGCLQFHLEFVKDEDYDDDDDK